MAGTLNIVQSAQAYEQWLGKELHGALIRRDLCRKHEKMASGAFPFLRATYWRWAERIFEPDVCPGVADAPIVLAVGDIHLENFGVWRDADGRLVWGVNDFDEAARMPYMIDLVRLAVSAVLAPKRRISIAQICSNILQGYAEGLKNPAPFLLDDAHPWLRAQFVLRGKARRKAWAKLQEEWEAESKKPDGKKASKKPPEAFRIVIESSLMDYIERSPEFWPRVAGTGSLGRPRWAGRVDWRGGIIIREGKAIVESGWSRAHPRAGSKSRTIEAAAGRYRAPDPWYVDDKKQGLVVRRLSPNSRKLESAKEGAILLHPKMLRAMGHELANVHLGTAGAQAAIRHDFAKRRLTFRTAVDRARRCVEKDFGIWKRRWSLETDKNCTGKVTQKGRRNAKHRRKASRVSRSP